MIADTVAEPKNSEKFFDESVVVNKRTGWWFDLPPKLDKEIELQTSLPYPDFGLSARVLDRQRLGKQRVEAYQILRTICGHTVGWRNHPAVKMWYNHSYALERYLAAMIDEWVHRGYENNISFGARDMEDFQYDINSSGLFLLAVDPPWLGDERVHRSHRQALLAKNPEHYRNCGWNEFLDPDWSYYWPI